MNELIQTIQEYHVVAIVLAVIILALTIACARVATRVTRNLLSTDDKPVPKNSIAENIVRGVIWVIGGSCILEYCFGVDVKALVAPLGISGIALSFGLQDTISNIISGIQITSLGIIEAGDHVVIESTEGIVKNVTWRQTTVVDFENVVHMIPNSVINSTMVDKFAPANVVSTSISFTNDTTNLDGAIAEVERVAKEALEGVVELKRDPWILLTSINEYGTSATLRFVLKDMRYVREARDTVLRAITPLTRPQPEPSEAVLPSEAELPSEDQ